jgi:fatty acid synthase subunit beta
MSSSGEDSDFGSETPMTTPRTSPFSSPPMNTYLKQYRRRSSCASIASIDFGSLEFSFRIPNTLHFRASQLIFQYSEFLSQPGNEPKTEEGLVARFLLFIADGGTKRTHNSADNDLLNILIVAFEQRFLGDDVHCLKSSKEEHEDVIGCYYEACAHVNRPHNSKTPALFLSADAGTASIYTIFGGQGNTTTVFEEIRNVHGTYTPFVAEFLVSAAELLISLSRDKRCRKTFSGDFDILKWLHLPGTTPKSEVLLTAPYSFPLIGLLQLLNYMVACKVTNETPCTFRRHLSGTTGHSQGIVTAVVTAAADSWESFDSVARSALTVLFWIGVRSQQAYPPTVLSPDTIKDSVDHGEGVPSPMLSVRDLSQSTLVKYIDKTNTYFPTDSHVSIALINNSQSFVVSGPPLSLHGLNVRLRQIKASPDVDQSRIPHSKRKPTFTNSFLPITAPFHSNYLASATRKILEDVKDLEIKGRSLRISVFHPSSGEDLSRSQDNLIPQIVRMITEEVVDWPLASKFKDATHILDFGPGGASGIGMLTNRNKEGRGIRVILADRLEGFSTVVGYRSELFTRQKEGIRFGSNWAKDFSPRLIRTATGTVVDTKLSRVLGLPPFIIGGMTPTTVPWDFVAAAMNAGYHIELAAGGYHNADALEAAILKLETAIPVGRGITVNVIYASPQSIAWQIPLLARLRSQGVPIDGLTVGAGVPSPEIAQSYIKSIGLKHISFKPGSSAAIEAVINIAKANPSFPIILQWTGGRAGGHHSFEDFHQPILGSYEKIRQCQNLILVAGSGFGGARDTYPYLNGAWSLQFGSPRMPFDGCLFGSRMMVAKEAHTSPDAKLAIVKTPGLSDSDWEKTYKGPDGAGGIVTVISEMGEPIHMLATRGAKFWSEMDQTVFKLPAAQQLEVLKTNQKMIVKRLNEDFQKVWFGRNSEGHPVEVEDMTYEEVLNRLVELLYVQRAGNWEWIDKSYEKLTYDFIRRVQERFQVRRDRLNVAKVAISEDPRIAAELCLNAYPMIRDQYMTPQDVSYFFQLCERRGQKPVPFVPVLDDHFQVYFKKDSLWQSEDLEAVVGRDVGRTCILQGPVAARHSTRTDESIKEIMDGINEGHTLALVAEGYGGTICSIPGATFPWTRLGNKTSTLDALAHINEWMVSETTDKHIYRVPDSEESPLPSTDSWLHLLAGSERNWREVLFLSNTVMRGHRYQRNPIKDIFAPVPGHVVEISYPNDDTYGCVHLKKRCPERGEYTTLASVEFLGTENKILLCLWSRTTPTSRGIPLKLHFTYHPESSNTPIREVLDNRNERIRKFYWQTWFGDDKSYDSNTDVSGIFEGDEIIITEESIQSFAESVDYSGESTIGRVGKEIVSPIDYSIVPAWKAITKPLFCESLDGNLLDLVYLSNDFRMVPGAAPLKAGETVLTMSRVTAVVNQDAGRMIEVRGTVMRQKSPVIEIVSRFLFRGLFTDFNDTFEIKQEAPVEVRLDGPSYVAILTSKPWIQLDLEDPESELLNKTLEFRLSTTQYFKSKNTFEIVKTTGDILERLPTGSTVKIGSVIYHAGISRNNPVLDYLRRHGSEIDQPITLKNPIVIKNDEILVAPASNEDYADASGDTNPIHVSHVFSQYVNLPGTITHGMWTSAAVRNLLEVSDNHAGKVRSWNVKFVGMVLPNDTLNVTFEHTAMIRGRKLIKVEARKANTNELVLSGESEVDQPKSAYIFTGQGSQRKGMGMELRESSTVARAVWDRADNYFEETFGFNLTHIVKNDPKELTIHFGGPKGKRIRQNYMDLTQETTLSDGTVVHNRLLQDIIPTSTSYTFRSPLGLLSATQFTQPALTLMEIALFSDMVAKGLVQENSMFAGHSLGEYSALAALGGEMLPIEVPVAITFFRGLAMQLNVERDASGRSDYSMCAINPSKIPNFKEENLKELVQNITQETGWLVEIVNFNIENMQYICAGEIRALALMTEIANHLIKNKTSSFSNTLIKSLATSVEARPKPLDYERGPATVPLKQIDVPFHSSFLSKNVPSYRKFLSNMILKEKVDPSLLVGKWIPNITGKPFGIQREDFEELERVTGSLRVRELLERWEEFMERREGTEGLGIKMSK